MADVLTLATAGLKAGQLADTAHIRYPRVDYLELQRLLNTHVLDYTAYDHNNLGKHLRRLETKLRSDLYLTLIGLIVRHSYRLIFTMSERAGIPFSGLQRMLYHKKPLVSMFQCWSWRQEYAVTKLRLFSAMDQIIVHCQSMEHHFINLGAPPERIHVIPYSIDHNFYSPQPESERRNFIMSLGEVRSRDYATLFQAVNGLPTSLVVAASGRWYAREKESNLQSNIPANVTIIKHLPPAELRKLYTQSQFVIVPVYDMVYSAGATATLESMSMGRAIIATRSQGLMDYIIDGETGILVEPGDVKALREAIEYLVAHPAEARRLGQNARQRVDEELNLDNYVGRIAQLLRSRL